MSLPFLLLDFDFLFHVYLLTVNIGEPILQEGQTLVWDNLYSESVFRETSPWFTYAAMYGWMYSVNLFIFNLLTR